MVGHSPDLYREIHVRKAFQRETAERGYGGSQQKRQQFSRRVGGVLPPRERGKERVRFLFEKNARRAQHHSLSSSGV